MNRDIEPEIRELIAKHKRRVWFSLEYGRGETYANNKPTLYAHFPYPRSSVLAGREARAFVDQWETVEDANRRLKELTGNLPAFKVDVMLGGSTHIPIAQIVAGIPDDTDY